MTYKELSEELQANLDSNKPLNRNSSGYMEAFKAYCYNAMKSSSCGRYLSLEEPSCQSTFLEIYGEVAGCRVQIGVIRENTISREHPVEVFLYDLEKYGCTDFERAVLLMAKGRHELSLAIASKMIKEAEDRLNSLKREAEKEQLHIEGIERLLSETGSDINKEMDGAFIKERRKAAGLTQKQLGQKIGKAEITIRQYEGGARTPDLETKIAIAGALGIGYGHLLSIGTNNMREAIPVNELAETAYSHPSTAGHEETDIKLPEDIMETFPDWKELQPGNWSEYGKFLTYEDGCKVEVGLYREPMDGGEYAGTYTLQIYNCNDVIFCSKVEEVK